MSDNKNSGLVFMGLGFELMALIVVGVYVGNAIDRYFGWPGWGFLGMLGLLLAAWITHFVFLIKRYMKATSDSDPKS